jgi:Protein of unknown function (DUF3752)
MMMPPKQDDLAARMDPMKQRARGFNAGRAANAAAPAADNGMWTETPEQKRKRLENEVLGIAAPTAATAATKTKKRKDEKTARKLKEQIVSLHLSRSLKLILTAPRIRSVVNLCTNGIRSPNRKNVKTIPASVHLTVRKTWLLDQKLGIVREKKCSTKLQTSTLNSLLVAFYRNST